MPAFPPFPGLLQNGYRLGSVLETLERTQVLETVDLQQGRYLLEQLTPFPGLIPASDLKRADRMLFGGEARAAFQLLAVHETNIRCLYQRYLDESALRMVGMTLEQARARPWRTIVPTPYHRRIFEAFHDVADLKLNWEGLERLTRARLAQDDKLPGSAQQTENMVYGRYANLPRVEHQPMSPAEVMWAGELDRKLERAGLGRAYGYWKQDGGLRIGEIGGRIYLSLRRDQAFEIWRYLARTLEVAARRKGVEIKYKMSTVSEGFERFDSAVIYFRPADELVLYHLVAKMHRTHPEFFKPGIPAFAMPLSGPDGYRMEGVSFGQDPGAHESFGGSRSRIVTRAIQIARLLSGLGQSLDWEELCRMFVFFLREAEIDVNNPAFENGGREKFPFIASLPLAPSLVPEESLVIDAATSRSLIASEIRSRYPALGGANHRDWVPRMAADIYTAWEKSGQGPGSGPRAPTIVPEEIFDTRMSLLFDYVSRNPSRAELLKQILASDQGQRLVRAVAAMLKGSFPSLKEPRMENVVRTFAESVHLTWKSQSPKVGETSGFFEAVYLSRLAWMRKHLEAQAATLNQPLRRLLTDLDAYFFAN